MGKGYNINHDASVFPFPNNYYVAYPGVILSKMVYILFLFIPIGYCYCWRDWFW